MDRKLENLAQWQRHHLGAKRPAVQPNTDVRMARVIRDRKRIAEYVASLNMDWTGGIR